MASTNRLSLCTSPYLLQHAHNPVDWFPWGEEALSKARAEDKPIFLSVGYSACHWCHVMERESFEDPLVAALLNQDFVAIKVDREERPDLDDLYMGAVQAIAGRGGWPMSVWLTPQLEPFYGGTYFPPEPRFGFPGFPQLLRSIAEAWRHKRQAVVEDSQRLAEALRRQAEVEPGSTLPAAGLFKEVLSQLRRSFDAEWGGFGPAPKFPPVQSVEFLLRRGTPAEAAMALRTLDAMAAGGLFDHLGGGFARYSVDERWLVPHFEKMLYDNASLASTYLSAYQATGEERYARVARATLDYLLRDLRDPSGGFHSSEDADSEGEEGRFYTFTPPEVRTILGDADGALFCEAFGIDTAGHLEDGRSVLHRFDAPEELAGRVGLTAEALEAKLEALRQGLWEARERRVRPHKDDKVLASWNGLALAALARGYQVLGDARYLEAAGSCAEFLQRELYKDEVLLRTWRRGQAHTSGFLEDYAAVALGVLDLYETTFEERWLRWAERLAELLLARFGDPEAGGFFATEAGQSDLLLRQKPGFDHSLPAGNALAAMALLRLGHQLDRADFLTRAEGTLRCFAPYLEKAPRACLGLLEALELFQQGALEIVVAGPRREPRTEAFLRRIWAAPLAHRMLVLVEGDPVPGFHAEKRPVGGQPTVYVCRNRTCLDPVTSVEALDRVLSARQF